MKDNKSDEGKGPTSKDITQETLEEMFPDSELSVIPGATMLVKELDKLEPGFAERVKESGIFPKGEH